MTEDDLATACSQPDCAGMHASSTERVIASMPLQIRKCGHTPVKSSVAVGITSEWEWSTNWKGTVSRTLWLTALFTIKSALGLGKLLEHGQHTGIAQSKFVVVEDRVIWFSRHVHN